MPILRQSLGFICFKNYISCALKKFVGCWREIISEFSKNWNKFPPLNNTEQKKIKNSIHFRDFKNLLNFKTIIYIIPKKVIEKTFNPGIFH